MFIYKYQHFFQILRSAQFTKFSYITDIVSSKIFIHIHRYIRIIKKQRLLFSMTDFAIENKKINI